MKKRVIYEDFPQWPRLPDNNGLYSCLFQVAVNKNFANTISKSYSRTFACVHKHPLRLLRKKCALHITTRNVAYDVPQNRANLLF